MKVMQDTLLGGPKIVTGNRIRDQLAEIMANEPETRDDEDLLAARWLEVYGGFGRLPAALLVAIVSRYRKANIRERRRELKGLFPFSPEEEERRQARAKGGPPG